MKKQSAPVYTDEMYKNKELPAVGARCLVSFPSENFDATITYQGNGVGAFINNKTGREYSFTTNRVRFAPTDTRTDEEKLIDDVADTIRSEEEVHVLDKVKAKLLIDKFGISPK